MLACMNRDITLNTHYDCLIQTWSVSNFVHRARCRVQLNSRISCSVISKVIQLCIGEVDNLKPPFNRIDKCTKIIVIRQFTFKL